MATSLNDYSKLDRMLHRLAFSGTAVQFAAADCESAAFGRSYRNLPGHRPILITSLPRAGTTILLSALARLPQLGTHRYRDMPFVMAPLLWNRLSRRARKALPERERAHGDGINISADSPEAFEEVLWHAFWPGKYGDSAIELWTAADRDDAAESFLRDHFRKIVAIRCSGRMDARYLSKNNANIGRIDYLAAALPDAAIVVPVRRPLEHAASLLRQHRNFLALHARDSFAKRYMADIGHFEFGALHRPIRFPGFDVPHEPGPDDICYWLAYWIAAFRYLHARRAGLTFVSYEALCADGPGVLGTLCECLGLDRGAAVDALGREFRQPPGGHAALTTNAAPRLREEAEALYRELLRR